MVHIQNYGNDFKKQKVTDNLSSKSGFITVQSYNRMLCSY